MLCAVTLILPAASYQTYCKQFVYMHCAGKISFFPAASWQMHCEQIHYMYSHQIAAEVDSHQIAAEVDSHQLLQRWILS
jgi:hypothetical protein